MPQIRIRHLMSLVLYVAVALALCMPAIEALRMPAFLARVSDRSVPFLIATVGVPLAWGCLTWFVARVGPVRDWLTVFFLCLGLALMIPWLFVAISRNSQNWPIALLITLAAEIYLVRTIADHLIPETCPGCLKKGVVRALKFAVRLRADRYTYTRCRGCGFEGWVIWKRRLPPCPCCHQEELVRPRELHDRSSFPRGPHRFSHYWCLACGSRWKRAGPGDPFLASGPDDDPYYSSWSYPGWLRSWIERTPLKEDPP